MTVASLQITCGGPWFAPAARPSIDAEALPLTGFRQWADALPADCSPLQPCRIKPDGSSYAIVMD
jgi:hypothetical protein